MRRPYCSSDDMADLAGNSGRTSARSSIESNNLEDKPGTDANEKLQQNTSRSKTKGCMATQIVGAVWRFLLLHAELLHASVAFRIGVLRSIGISTFGVTKSQRTQHETDGQTGRQERTNDPRTHGPTSRPASFFFRFRQYHDAGRRLPFFRRPYPS